MDRKEIKHLLKIVEGQLNGINKMLDDGVYCIDISNQLMASIALLKKANVVINRKMLAEMAVSDAAAFAKVAEVAKKAK